MTDTTRVHGMEQPFISDESSSVLGVPGWWSHRTIKPGRPVALFFRQRFVTIARPALWHGPGCVISAELRFDDECGNGHNTFSITGSVRDTTKRGHAADVAGGCLHEDISRAFPEFAGLIRWHLTSTDGPMHYPANVVYFAGDRDHRRKRAGECYAWKTAVRFGRNPIAHCISEKFWQWLQDYRAGVGGEFDFEVIGYPHRERETYGTKYTFGGFGDSWYACPFDTEREALAFLAALQTCEPEFVKIPHLFSEGKPREFDKARSAAIWPDATDEQLSAEPEQLRVALLARLPALLAEFRADMEDAGFLWSADVSAPVDSINR